MASQQSTTPSPSAIEHLHAEAALSKLFGHPVRLPDHAPREHAGFALRRYGIEVFVLGQDSVFGTWAGSYPNRTRTANLDICAVLKPGRAHREGGKLILQGFGLYVLSEVNDDRASLEAYGRAAAYIVGEALSDRPRSGRCEWTCQFCEKTLRTESGRRSHAEACNGVKGLVVDRDPRTVPRPAPDPLDAMPRLEYRPPTDPDEDRDDDFDGGLVPA